MPCTVEAVALWGMPTTRTGGTGATLLQNCYKVQYLLRAATKARFWQKLHHVCSRRGLRSFHIGLVVAIGKTKPQLKLHVRAFMVACHYIWFKLASVMFSGFGSAKQTNKAGCRFVCLFEEKKFQLGTASSNVSISRYMFSRLPLDNTILRPSVSPTKFWKTT